MAEAVGELLAGTGRDDPYPLFERIRSHGPLARVQDRFYVATGYAVIDEILRDPRWLMPDHEFAYPLPIRVICALLGVPAADQQWFREQAAALTAVLEPSIALAGGSAADEATLRLERYFTGLVRQRRGQPADDLTTALVQAHDADGAALSTEELLANLILLLVAGFETTTNLLGNGLATLLRYPDLAASLRDAPTLAPAYVEEMLRHDPPVQLTIRWCRDELLHAGVRVQPYSQVLLLLAAGNRDPDRFAEPDAFNPARRESRPLTFGAGAHYCLGALLARLEAQIAFPLLMALPPRAAGAPTRRQRVTLRGYATLPVTVT